MVPKDKHRSNRQRIIQRQCSDVWTFSYRTGWSDAHQSKHRSIARVGDLYKRLTPVFLVLLKFREAQYTLKNISKPTKKKIDHILSFSKCFMSVSARLARDWVWEQDVVPCEPVLDWTKLYLGALAILGVLVDRRHVNNAPAWCGATSTSLCMGRGDPYPSWRNYLVENGIKMTKKFCVSLGGLTLVVKRQYS